MHRRLQSIALVIMTLVCLVTATNAEAMYDPGTGRFAQRDPSGTPGFTAPRPGVGGAVATPGTFLNRDANQMYPDGMNLYAAYHVMRGGVDPSGNVVVVTTGGIGHNPFRSGLGPKKGKFTSRKAYQDQIKALAKEVKGINPVYNKTVPSLVDIGIEEVATQIATYGYDLYLDQASNVQSYAQAIALCIELQLLDVEGKLGKGAQQFTAWQATRSGRVTGIYGIKIVKHKGDWYANASHVEKTEVQAKFFGLVPISVLTIPIDPANKAGVGKFAALETIDDLNHRIEGRECPLCYHED